MAATQLELFEKPNRAEEVSKLIIDLLPSHEQPSASEFIEALESKVGLEARWELPRVLAELPRSSELTNAEREYIHSLFDPRQRHHMPRKAPERPQDRLRCRRRKAPPAIAEAAKIAAVFASTIGSFHELRLKSPAGRSLYRQLSVCPSVGDETRMHS